MEIALALLFPCDRRHEWLLLFDGNQRGQRRKKKSELEQTRIIILLLITVADVAWKCVGIGSSALFMGRMFASVCYLAYKGEHSREDANHQRLQSVECCSMEQTQTKIPA